MLAAVPLGVGAVGGMAVHRRVQPRRRPAVVGVGVPEHDALDPAQARGGGRQRGAIVLDAGVEDRHAAARPRSGRRSSSSSGSRRAPSHTPSATRSGSARRHPRAPCGCAAFSAAVMRWSAGESCGGKQPELARDGHVVGVGLEARRSGRRGPSTKSIALDVHARAGGLEPVQLARSREGPGQPPAHRRPVVLADRCRGSRTASPGRRPRAPRNISATPSRDRTRRQPAVHLALSRPARSGAAAPRRRLARAPRSRPGRRARLLARGGAGPGRHLRAPLLVGRGSLRLCSRAHDRPGPTARAGARRARAAGRLAPAPPPSLARRAPLQRLGPGGRRRDRAGGLRHARARLPRAPGARARPGQPPARAGAAARVHARALRPLRPGGADPRPRGLRAVDASRPRAHDARRQDPDAPSSAGWRSRARAACPRSRCAAGRSPAAGQRLGIERDRRARPRARCRAWRSTPTSGPGSSTRRPGTRRRTCASSSPSGGC